MNRYLYHALSRVRAVLALPAALITLALTGAAGVLFWPHTLDIPQIPSEEGLVFLVLWIGVLPMLLSQYVRGGSANSQWGGLGLRDVCPVLPLHRRGRAAAEAAATVVLMASARLVCAPLFHLWEPARFMFANEGAPQPLPYLGHTLLGALVLFPFAIAWSAAAEVWVSYLLRPVALAALLAAIFGLGGTAGPGGMALTAALLTAAAVVSVGWEAPTLAWPAQNRFRPAAQSRAARPPKKQFYRDLWRRSLPMALALAGVVAAVTVVNGLALAPDRWREFMAACTGGLIVGLIGFRPMWIGNFLLATPNRPARDPSGYGAGPWALLPLPREIVARGLYLYGSVAGALLWALLISARAASVWLSSGAIGLNTPTAPRFGDMFLPMFLIAPVLGGFLSAAAMGDNRLIAVTTVCGTCLFLQRPLTDLIGIPGLRLPLLITCAALGALAPLVHLVNRRK